MKKVYLLLMVFCVAVVSSCHKNDIEGTTNTTTFADIHETTIEQINDQLNGGTDFLVALNNSIENIKQSPAVKTSYIKDDNIVIVYNSGAVSIIAFIDENGEAGKSTTSNSFFGKVRQTKAIKSDNDLDLITNHNVLIWDPFSDGFTSNQIHTGDYLQNEFESSSLDFTVNLLKGNQCTLSSLTNLTQYGFVYIKTHGGVVNVNGEDYTWLLTGEKVPLNMELPGNKEKFFVTIAEVVYGFNSEIKKIKTHGDHYWGISNKYITNHVNGTFNSPAVVFVQACHSYDNASLRNAFINDKKSSAFLGYQHGVSHSFGYSKAMEFVRNMLVEKMEAYQAYDAIEKKQDNSILGILCGLESGEGAILSFSSPLHANPTYFADENNEESYDGYLFCDQLNISCPIQNMTFGANLLHVHAYYPNMEHVYTCFHFTYATYQLGGGNSLPIGDYHPLSQPATSDEYNYINDNDPYGFWAGIPNDNDWWTYWFQPSTVKFDDSDKIIVNGALSHSSANSTTFWFTDEEGHYWHGFYNAEIHHY